ncbi:SGNH/GDSL hydrolase family protein [Paenibacillus sp. GCM10027626]|uniref:SGNH/GDSL hydrolase family protein n=1 Tax=Paenibacillus sp. GCM10027626 TaxID=3273411 RepID=UPI003636ABE4
MSQFPRFQQRLQEKAQDVFKRAVTYVAIGDSVTQGCMQHEVVEYTDIYHQVFRRAAEQRYQGTVLNVINSGVSGDTAEGSRSRWERDVLLYKPDLVTICFGHNDAHGGMDGIATYIQAIRDLVDQIQAETEAEVLLITPCMMMKRNNANIAEVHRPLTADFIRLAESGVLDRYVAALKQFAAERGLPCLDVYAEWEEMERKGEDIHALLSNGLNHPDQSFHRRWGALLEAKLLD